MVITRCKKLVQQERDITANTKLTFLGLCLGPRNCSHRLLWSGSHQLIQGQDGLVWFPSLSHYSLSFYPRRREEGTKKKGKNGPREMHACNLLPLKSFFANQICWTIHQTPRPPFLKAWSMMNLP